MKTNNIKENAISKTPISTHNHRKELKMAKTKNRIKKMTFQKQERTFNNAPLSDDDKYIIEMAGYRKTEGRTNETFQRTTGRSTRPEYI
jgi:hypothetical protein